MSTNKRKRVASPREGSRFAIYVRRSVADEGGRSKSCEQQLERCLLACRSLGVEVPIDRQYREREGCKGDWWYEGEGRAGPFRPELTRLVRDIEAGNIDAVLVWRTDRYYRDSAIADDILGLMREHGVRLYVMTTDLAVHTASGLQSAMVEAAANRGFRDRIAEDVRRDKEFKAALGLITGNASCYGFRSRKGGSRQVDPVWEELDIVNLVFRWFVEGDGEGGPLSRGAIARRLMTAGLTLATNARGHSNKHPRFVSERRIKTLLQNPMYAGRWAYDGVTRDCEALLISRNGEAPRTAVPLELYEAAQLRLAGYGSGSSQTSATEKRALASLVVCGHCGAALHVNVGKLVKGKRTARWICPNRPKGSCSGDYSGVRVDVLDEWAQTYLADMINAEYQAMKGQRKTGSSAEELTLAVSLLEQHKKKEAQQLALVLAHLDAQQVASVAAEMRATRLNLEARVSELSTRLAREQEPEMEVGMRTMSQAAFGAAMRRCVRWLAITPRGVVVLTAWGAYIAGAFQAPPQARLVQHGDHRKLLPPGVLATRECVSWISDPEKFVRTQQVQRRGRMNGADAERILPRQSKECVA